MLTPENYNTGLLVDDDLMAGVALTPDELGGPDRFAAYVIQHTTGEYLGYKVFDDLVLALKTLNAIPRPWKFERTGGCGDSNCEGGKCSSGACAVKTRGEGPPALRRPEAPRS